MYTYYKIFESRGFLYNIYISLIISYKDEIREVKMKLLLFLNYFFLVFHGIFTCFNLTGWAFKKTRKLHLAAIALTAFSWYVVGLWFGPGYCFCTDWHWRVRGALGFPNRLDSYIHFLILEITGIDFPQQLVDDATLYGFIAAVVLTIILNIKDFVMSRK